MTAVFVAPGRAVAASTSRSIAGQSAIRLTDVTKVYGQGDAAVTALEGLSLDVPTGGFVCLVGASGCGKSTLLNIVAGLDTPSAGAVEIAGGPPALIFQEAALFPWLTAAGNVELALKLRGVPRSERRDRVADLLRRVHLLEFARKRPHELSGGMRQRVALARALAQDARILLMDEPFGALDALTRDLLHEELELLWRDGGLTVLFVTHNVREAVRLGDRVVVLSSRPGRAVAEFPVAIGGHRRIESPEVAALSVTIRDRLGEEVRRASSLTGGIGRSPEAEALAAELSAFDRLEGGPRVATRVPLRVVSALGPKLAALAIVLIAWQVIVLSGWRPTYLLPAPATVLAELASLVQSGVLGAAVAVTVKRALLGYLVAVLAGVALGVAVSRWSVLRSAVGSLITGLQTMPSIAWFPLAILLFGLNETAILFVVVLGAAPRSRTASSPASTRCRRSCCGPDACSARGASAHTGTSCCRPPCRASSAASSRAGRSPGAA